MITIATFLNEPEVVACDGDCSSYDSTRTIEHPKKIASTSPKEKLVKSPLPNANSATEKTTLNIGRKSIDEQWCIAKEELSQSDFDYAMTLEQDWDEYIGKSFAKGKSAIYSDDANHLNNSYVASYQELPIEELQERALSGDKWAMITFVQSWYGDHDAKKEIANRLLVLGASYHAVEYLVIKELAAAKTSYKKTGQVKKSSEHMINAAAYVMFGLKDFNISALTAFIGNTSRNELFQGPLYPTLIFSDAQYEIRERYLELVSSIEQAREEQSIIIERPSEVIKKLFTQDLASFQYREGEAVEYLQSLQITSDVNLNQTPCTKNTLLA